jgi:2-C-methyl-D-erythritol 4-phosphate cytidylyltransferase
MKIGVVLVCAGIGKRFGKADKAVAKLSAKPLFLHALKKFLDIKAVSQVALVMRTKNFSVANRYARDKRIVLVEGGKERQDSVQNGLLALDKKITHVLIHDGARPFVDKATILRVINALKKGSAVICAVSAKDTIKTTRGGVVRSTLDRNQLVCVQTPQGFKKELIEKGYKKLRKKVFDDAQVIELMGKKVKVVKGSEDNIKVTYAKDLK